MILIKQNLINVKRTKKYTKEEKLAIVELSLEKGANIQEQAKRFKVTDSTIYN